MAQLHRIKWFHERLLKNKFPNCRKYAQQFEISRRQALRDVEYLKYSLNAPLEYNHQKRGYYYTDTSFSLPTFFLSNEEQNSLNYLAQQYALIPGSSAKAMSDFFQRLSGKGNTVAMPSKASSLNFEEVVCKAISYQSKLEMLYKNADSTINRRLIHPYRIILKNNKSYLFAFCEKRLDFRVFLISRIAELTISNEQYVFHPDFNENFNSTRQHLYSPRKYTARIWFSIKPYTHLFTQPSWDRETNILTFSFIEPENLFKKLINLDLSYKNTAYRILSPNWLREKLMEKMTVMLKILE